MLRENPYAEWYLNTMRIKGSPTARHHAQVYGDDYPYDNFVKTFDDATAGANLDALAGLCAGGRSPLRRPDDEASRRVRAVAVGGAASGEGGVPRAA